MARSRGFTRPRGRSRRRTGWDEGPLSTTLLVNAASQAQLWSTAQTAAQDGLTVARLRGSWSLQLDSAGSAGDGFQAFAVGIGIVSLAAFTAGQASVPSPLTEIEWEGWLYHELVTGVTAGATTPTWADSGGPFFRGVIDSKAMRKIGTQEVIFGSIETWEEIGAATGGFHAHTRMLLMLP